MVYGQEHCCRCLLFLEQLGSKVHKYNLRCWRTFLLFQGFYAMSRCFRFPPPGYAKKVRLEDVDLLKKEKNREKKLRKEKKDKEKRDRKEKKHKDRSKEKYKENKEKKVKNRDKRNDKDRGKDTQNPSDEKRLMGKSKNHHGGNLARKEDKVDDSSLFEKTYSWESAGYNGVMLFEGNHLAEKTKRSEPMHDARFRNKDKEGKDCSATQSERHGKMARATSMEVVEKIKDGKVDDTKIGGLGIRKDEKFSTRAMVQNMGTTVRTGVEVVSRPPPLGKKDSKPSEKKTEGRKETKEETGGGEGNEKRKEKHKDKDRENKYKTKDKDKEKEKNKEEKKLEKLDDSAGEQYQSSHSLKASQLSADGRKSATPDGNSNKRKDLERNGFLHADDSRPMKFQKLTSSGHPNPGNGKLLGPYQTPIISALERQGTASKLELDCKEGKINGAIEDHPLASSMKHTPTRQIDQMVPQPPKPPHLDCRYLSQIYSFPKVEEWSGFCDQEWLSKSSSAQEKKPRSSKVEEMPLVWADAILIESADVCALPYVIPY